MKEALGEFCNDYFPLPLPGPWVWIFLGSSSWESSEFPGGNAHGCVGFPKSVALRTFQKSPRKVIDFQFVQLSLVVRMGLCLPSSLHARVDTRSLYLKKWSCIYLPTWQIHGRAEEQLAPGPTRIEALNSAETASLQLDFSLFQHHSWLWLVADLFSPQLQAALDSQPNNSVTTQGEGLPPASNKKHITWKDCDWLTKLHMLIA